MMKQDENQWAFLQCNACEPPVAVLSEPLHFQSSKYYTYQGDVHTVAQESKHPWIPIITLW